MLRKFKKEDPETLQEARLWRETKHTSDLSVINVPPIIITLRESDSYIESRILEVMKQQKNYNIYLLFKYR